MFQRIQSVIEGGNKERTTYKLYNFTPMSLKQTLLWVLFAPH